MHGSLPALYGKIDVRPVSRYVGTEGPVPEVLQEGDVKTLNKQVFDDLDRLSAPRLVEYWEKDRARVGGSSSHRFCWCRTFF